MSDKTGIQWTDATWNPVSGCTKVSPGCKNCYAERDWARLSKNPKSPYFGRAFTDVRCHPDRLDQPLRWRDPRRIFVNSMSDLFHESVPDRFIDDVFSYMWLAKRHTFQILTKRPERMREYVSSRGISSSWDGPLQNVWLGVSVENQATADERIPILLQTPSAVRFLSVEPLLEGIALGTKSGNARCPIVPAALDWVIVGGESGTNARPCNIEWIRDVVRQCKAAAVPVFVKQLGSNCRGDWGDGHGPYDMRHPLTARGGGDPTEWPEDLRVREFPR